MKMLRILVMTAAVCAVISQQPLEASVGSAAVQATGVAPAGGGNCADGFTTTQTATTTATVLAGMGTWTTIKNPSTTVDVLCDACTGFNATYAYKIGATTTSPFVGGIANFAMAPGVICCKVAAATLAFSYTVGKNCP